eukprot:SAG31_NODE_2187_length_6236_cov_2.337135_1_plen_44_part_00
MEDFWPHSFSHNKKLVFSAKYFVFNNFISRKVERLAACAMGTT